MISFKRRRNPLKFIFLYYFFAGKLYAMKILQKEVIEKRNQILHTKSERKIMETADHPFIVRLHYAFQTDQKLYLVTDFMKAGFILIFY